MSKGFLKTKIYQNKMLTLNRDAKLFVKYNNFIKLNLKFIFLLKNFTLEVKIKKMKYLILLISITLINCLKHGEYVKPHHSKVKFVNYAFKLNDKISIKIVPVKSLKIEPFDDWIAKAVWDGDNYNSTGYLIKSIKGIM